MSQQDYGQLLSTFSGATTRWHFRFSPVYDALFYEKALAVVLASSKPISQDALKPGTDYVASHKARMRAVGKIDVEALVSGDMSNRLILWSEVMSGRLRKRRFGVSRLLLDLNDGSTLKLIWMPRGPLAQLNGPATEVADTLRRVLGARITVEQ
jgi:hypothetical protein